MAQQDIELAQAASKLIKLTDRLYPSEMDATEHGLSEREANFGRQITDSAKKCFENARDIEISKLQSLMLTLGTFLLFAPHKSEPFVDAINNMLHKNFGIVMDTLAEALPVDDITNMLGSVFGKGNVSVHTISKEEGEKIMELLKGGD